MLRLHNFNELRNGDKVRNVGAGIEAAVASAPDKAETRVSEFDFKAGVLRGRLAPLNLTNQEPVADFFSGFIEVDRKRVAVVNFYAVFVLDAGVEIFILQVAPPP